MLWFSAPDQSCSANSDRLKRLLFSLYINFHIPMLNLYQCLITLKDGTSHQILSQLVWPASLYSALKSHNCYSQHGQPNGQPLQGHSLSTNDLKLAMGHPLFHALLECAHTLLVVLKTQHITSFLPFFCASLNSSRGFSKCSLIFFKSKNNMHHHISPSLPPLYPPQMPK